MNRPEKSREELWKIPGWGKMSPRSLGYLRELWHWRDGMAARRDKPPFKIISNDQILTMSVQLASGESVTLPPRFRPAQQERFEQAVDKVKALPEDKLPQLDRKKRLAKAKD